MTSLRRSKYRSWDVVLVPFPYTDRTHAKVRPAVVVSASTLSDSAGMYYVAMITSAAHPAWQGDVPVSDLRAAGLPAASVVRPAKIATIDERALIRAIGKLPKSDREQVASSIHRFLAFRPEVA
ncbi:MAG: type II toxin-antitoxin system PemK/MazF family toxin [Gammaproteobacteria bacterium]|nr:type II toxin-antitoxin system PemK/MazF family toxin [Gammaproteobacteria bacterium]